MDREGPAVAGEGPQGARQGQIDGLLSKFESVMNEFDQPLSLGYCNVGRVMTTGGGVANFEIGDRVVSNGKRAEVVSVLVNLCARVPDAVSNDEAAFTWPGCAQQVHYLWETFAGQGAEMSLR
jgi:NADPH:quinone reductase-like Zn-dependent oxidoreductase